MLHVLSFALFSTVLVVSIGAIITTIRADLPLIMRALGVDPLPAPPIRPEGERRPIRIVRVVRQPLSGQMALSQRAAA
ncbi:hypothetical protein SAMN05444678_104144 [Sphingomonas sp. YR710]|jgi:hypothetical protein|uniref:hypothetical protein n=1 Tax=Sphingomonas sp. YR710 TaxID=1882773 RepID=UPI00088A5761|nr:hypothetical protein [Sphingomonas sp. YR710]SDC62816.1 hypothetical protein SAMN05444678_104144 [Sphingomonas sp. YR710]